MNLRDADWKWLALNFPELSYLPNDQRIAGELRFCAAFDRNSGQLRMGDTDEYRALGAFLCDAFRVRIDLGYLRDNGWPKVYEVGGRRFDIAEQNQCDMADLHFSDDDTCCLGIKYAPEKDLTLERFMRELMIPFFYRLSYTDRYGLGAARADLWGEYSHRVAGILEYRDEILRLVAGKPGRNWLCPCGSGLKYKKCHLDEVGAVKREWLYL